MAKQTGLKFEILFTGSTWVDVTNDVDYNGGYNLQLGRTSPISQPKTSSCSITLKNPTGQYTPGRAIDSKGVAVAQYPNVPGLQLRVSNSSGIRFVGDIQSWKPGYQNNKGVLGIVQVLAVDSLDRLGRLQLAAGILQEAAVDGPAYLWPLTDATGSSSAAESVALKSLRIANTSQAALAFGGTGPGPEGGTAVTLAPTAANAGQTLFQNGLSIQPAAGYTMMAWVNAGTVLPAWATGAGNVEIPLCLTGALLSAGSWLLLNNGRPSFISTGVALLSATAINDGEWHHIAATVGGLGNSTLYVDGVQVDSAVGISQAGTLSQIVVGDTANPIAVAAARFQGSVDYVELYGSVLSATRIAAHASAGLGYAGETVDERILRFLSYAGIGPSQCDIDASIVALNSYPQAGKYVLGAILDAIATEGGGSVFYVLGGRPRFRNRSFRRGGTVALTIDAVKDADGSNYQPAVDRTLLVNSQSVSQADAGGTLVTVSADNPASETTYGPYVGQMITSYAADPADAQHLGEWVVAENGTPALRLPQLAVDVLSAEANLYAQIQAVEVGSRVRVTGLPVTASGATQLDTFAEGWTETGSFDTQAIVLDCSPADNPARMVVGDALYGRLGCDGQTVDANVTASATTLGIDTADPTKPKFTVAAGSYTNPMYIRLGAEILQLMGPPTGTSPQVFTVARAQLGTTAAPITAGTVVELYPNATLSL